jgi:hypothetical protein
MSSTASDAEIAAMCAAHQALKSLDSSARCRPIARLRQRLGAEVQGTDLSGKIVLLRSHRSCEEVPFR